MAITDGLHSLAEVFFGDSDFLCAVVLALGLQGLSKMLWARGKVELLHGQP